MISLTIIIFFLLKILNKRFLKIQGIDNTFANYAAFDC